MQQDFEEQPPRPVQAEDGVSGPGSTSSGFTSRIKAARHDAVRRLETKLLSKRGRTRDNPERPSLWGGLLLLIACLVFFSCRRELPVEGSTPVQTMSFLWSPGNYFSYDNWKLDFFGDHIPSSYFRSSWTVVDTGRVMLGWSRVIVIVDSTFNQSNVLQRQDSLYFRITDQGDVFQYGFIRNLIADRETLNIAPAWDLIAEFSQPAGNSWLIERIDSSLGAHTNQTVNGNIISTEYVGATIDGLPSAVLSYRIEITKPQLDYTIWLIERPFGIARVFDNSEILPNATLSELTTMKSRR